MTAWLAGGGGRIEIRCFGSFSLRCRRAQMARNPRTGTPVSIGAKYARHFKLGMRLRARVGAEPEISEQEAFADDGLVKWRICTGGRDPTSQFGSSIRRQMGFESPVASVQPLLQHPCRSGFTLPSQRALPDDSHSPSGFQKKTPVPRVAVHVGLELRLPEFLTSGGGGGVRAPCVSVPETAVNEAHGSEPTKHEIGGTRQPSVVKTIPQTACVESPAENDFGYSVPAPNPGHHP